MTTDDRRMPRGIHAPDPFCEQSAGSRKRDQNICASS